MASWTSCFKFIKFLRPGTEQKETYDLDEYRPQAEGVLPAVDSSQDIGLLEMKVNSPEAGSSEEEHYSSEGVLSDVEDHTPETENIPEVDGYHFRVEKKPKKKRIKKSLLLQNNYVENLSKCLPSRFIGTKWVNVFDTELDGFTLGRLYRNFRDFPTEITCSLIVIKDSDAVFGAFVSERLKESRSTYGTGESFLFTNWPVWTVYPWSGVNDHYAKGDNKGLHVGASSNGNFALWLDEDLDKGRTAACDTFESGPLSKNEDFKIISVECWTFVSAGI